MELLERVEALERDLREVHERLQAFTSGSQDPAAASDEDVFWALRELRRRSAGAGAVLFTGTLGGPEPVEWQITGRVVDLLEQDWSTSSDQLSVLAGAVRLRILQACFHTESTSAEIAERTGLSATGALYHHLSQLTAARWLRQSGRGRYMVPPERRVALLVVMLATGSPA